MGQLKVAYSPLSQRIHAGSVRSTKDGAQVWRENQTDVTGLAAASVSEMTLDKGGEMVVTANGKPAYLIRVERIAAADDDAA